MNVLKSKILSSPRKSGMLFLLVFVLSFTLKAPLVFSAEEPVYNIATVDGNPTEWDLVNDFMADMYKAGDSSKNGKVLAKLYMRYDCNTETMYAYISWVDSNPILVTDEEEAWIKIGNDNDPVVSNHDNNDGTPPDFAWVGRYTEGENEYAEGWEASFHLATNETYDYQVKAHCNVYEDGEAQTAATDNLQVTIDCGTTDHGDAPTTGEYNYGEASHTIEYSGEGPKVKIGAVVDAEDSYSGDINATNDDNDGYQDDEEGIRFYKQGDGGTWIQILGDKFKIGDTYKVEVDATLAENETATLAAWFDFDKNASQGFDDEDKIIDNVTLPNSSATLSKTNTTFTTVTHSETFEIPSTADEGTTYIRFRLDAGPEDLIPTGLADDYGEVEDYATSLGDVEPIKISLVSFTAVVTESGVRITWQAVDEINHVGYNVYRSNRAESGYAKINSALITTAAQTHGDICTYDYVDAVDNHATYFYKLEDVNLDGECKMHGPVQATMSSHTKDQITQPQSFVLEPNYPNPFNAGTTIRYTVPEPARVRLEIYNLQGSKVRTLVNSAQAAGAYTVSWDAKDATGTALGSGLYFYKLTTGDISKLRRMTLLK
mgnify:CR=1 FL=1